MNNCSHGINWSYTNANSTSCLICVVEYMENDDKPLTCRETLLQEVLEGIKSEPSNYFTVLDQDHEIMKHVLLVLMDVYQKLNDNSLQKPILDMIVTFHQSFGDDIIEVIAAHAIELCASSSYRNHTNFLHVLLALFHHLPEIVDSLLASENFVDTIVSGLGYPDDQLRIVFINVFDRLVSRWVDGQRSLQHFKDLKLHLLNIMRSSDCHQVLIGSLHVLGECARCLDFVPWIVRNAMIPDTELTAVLELQGINELFASMKRVLLLRQDSLSLSVIQAIAILLQHDKLIQPLLDADLAELMYDALCGSTSDALISSAYTCILLLSDHEEFFTSCHAMYGMKSICKSLQHLIPGNAIQIIGTGYRILKVFFYRQPSHILLLQTLSSFDQVLQVVNDGIATSQLIVVGQAMAVSCTMLNHLPHPFPCQDLLSLLQHMENVIPDLLDVCGSQRMSEEAFDEGICFYLFEFIRECVRIPANLQQSDPHDEEECFIERCISSLLKVWIPLIKLHDACLSCTPMMEKFFLCMSLVLGSQRPSCEELWKKLVLEDFIDVALKLKTKHHRDENCASIVHAVVDFLCVLSEPLLHIFNNAGTNETLRNGYKNLTGKSMELLAYLGECAISSSGQIDRTAIHLQCAVLTLLALLYWHEKHFLPLDGVHLMLKQHASVHGGLVEFPLFAVKFLFFLLAVCQQESEHPELPVWVVSRLLPEDSLFFHHPAVLSVVLQCSGDVISKETKLCSIFEWISHVDFSSFVFHQDCKHLMGLMLLNEEVVDLVLDALSSSVDQTQSNKLILTLSAAIDESVSDDSDDGNSSSFHSMVCRRLPDLLNLDWDFVTAVPAPVTLSLLNLLQRILGTKGMSDEDALYQHRILRKLILLIVNGMKLSSESTISDEILTSILDIINTMFKCSNDQRNNLTELSLLLGNSDFLMTLDQLLSRPIKSFDISDVHYYVFELLSTLLCHEGKYTAKIGYTIKQKPEELLQYIEGYFGQQFQCGVLLCWNSLFKSKFKSRLFCLEPVAKQSNRLLNRHDIILAPLNRDFIVRLYTMALNCSAKGFPNIHEISLRCVHSILEYVRTISDDLFLELSSSPWLTFCLGLKDVIKDPENAEATRLCLLIEALKEYSQPQY